MAIEDVDVIEEVCKEFIKIRNAAQWDYGRTPEDLIKTCEILKAFGYVWGDRIKYPDFRITKGKYYITNSAKKYKPKSNDYYVQWDNGNIGRLQFVGNDYWYEVEDEWNEFREILMSYDPLDYDPMNCHMIFNVENGKRLMKDYKNICDSTKAKMMKKIKKIQLERKKKEYEDLLIEVEKEND